MKKQTILILHDIRSKINVGSIFRTADAVGVTKIYLTGYTPAPTDRFGRPVQEIAKSALGAELTIPWEKKKDSKSVIKKLKAENFSIIAVEQSKRSVDYKKVKVKNNTVIILWNEVDGAPKNILKMCDIVAEIPMRGEKESLNVSVAFGVAIFRILNI